MMQMACSCSHTNEAMYTSARRLYTFENDNVSMHPSVVGHVHEHVVISQHTSCNIPKAGRWTRVDIWKDREGLETLINYLIAQMDTRRAHSHLNHGHT